jgi:hypothetical protein
LSWLHGEKPQYWEQFPEDTVACLTIPTFDFDAIGGMQTEVLLNIIHNYRFVDAPTSLFDIFQICILPNCGVMAVKSFRYDFRRIDIINDPVSILLTRRSEYYYFVTL